MFAQAVVDGMAVVANVSPLWLVYRLLRSTQQTWPSVWQRIVLVGAFAAFTFGFRLLGAG